MFVHIIVCPAGLGWSVVSSLIRTLFPAYLDVVFWGGCVVRFLP